jgi:hypothetical protein
MLQQCLSAFSWDRMQSLIAAFKLVESTLWVRVFPGLHAVSDLYSHLTSLLFSRLVVTDSEFVLFTIESSSSLTLALIAMAAP